MILSKKDLLILLHMRINGFTTISVTLFLKIDTKKLKSHESDSEEDVEEIPFDQSKLQKKKNQGKTRSRMGISEEVFGSFNKKEILSLKMVPKSHETKLLIQSLIRHSILFQNIDYQDE